MCWPSLEGGLEVEERYPRTNDPREPRRRRLNFVRERSGARSSDDHALVHSSFHQTRPIREEMRERHDPLVLQQQDQLMRHLQRQNQDLQHLLMWEEQQRRRHELEMPHQQHGQAPRPPPPVMIPPQEQPRIEHHPQEGFPQGIGRIEENRPHVVEGRPRAPMPGNVRHGRNYSRGRSHGRHHSGASIYSDDRDSWRDYDRRRRGRSPIVYGSSHDSFDDLLPGHGPHVQRIIPRRR
ncbi:MAG: hypothetical protein LQ343_004316 [Gyalolechia ehrenbergii]|nr:MAG: hypothetical protein LQ343_004316 [Gyalolechia ehrenbergii]